MVILDGGLSLRQPELKKLTLRVSTKGVLKNNVFYTVAMDKLLQVCYRRIELCSPYTFIYHILNVHVLHVCKYYENYFFIFSIGDFDLPVVPQQPDISPELEAGRLACLGTP